MALEDGKKKEMDFNANYDKSGEIVKNPITNLDVSNENTTEDKFEREIVTTVIEQVRVDLKLPYQLQDFQIESIISLVNGRNVIIISPTGSGKSVIIIIALRVLESLLGTKLVALGSEPTENIITDKLGDSLVPAGSVGMTGRIEVTGGERDVKLSHTKEEMVSGDIKVIYGYQESWSNPTGKEIIEELVEKRMIAFIFFDEAHQNLAKFWGGWRREMMMGPSEMRLIANRPPVILMSATLTTDDTTNLKKIVGLRRNIVTIKRSPIVPNIKIVTVKRPTNQKGCGMTEGEDGAVVVEEGLMQPVMKTYLERFCADIENGVKPKIGIIFSENTEDLIVIQNYLFSRLGDAGRKKPWVLITSDTGIVTKKQMWINSRKGSIFLYLCTSVLLTGVNYRRIDIVLSCRPMPHLHLLVQAAGRGGREQEDGTRRLVVMYQLWNKQDLVVGRKGLVEDVKDFCQTDNCLRYKLEEHFGISVIAKHVLDNDWCCGNCDSKN